MKLTDAGLKGFELGEKVTAEAANEIISKLHRKIEALSAENQELRAKVQMTEQLELDLPIG